MRYTGNKAILPAFWGAKSQKSFSMKAASLAHEAAFIEKVS